MRLELVPTLLGRQPWPLLLIASLLGWTALLGLQHSLLVPEICSVMAASWPNLDARTIEAVLLVNSPIGLALSWLVMLLAMMPLLLAQPLLHLWVRSLARRRMRAIGAFLIAYFAVWMAAGPILLAIAVAVRMATKGSDVLAVALALVLALLWRVCPAPAGLPQSLPRPAAALALRPRRRPRLPPVRRAHGGVVRRRLLGADGGAARRRRACISRRCSWSCS